jgi:hypothetical protein
MWTASRERLGPGIEFLHQDCSQRWPLDEAFRCFKPGGRLICLGPNIRALPGAYWDFWGSLPAADRSLARRGARARRLHD